MADKNAEVLKHVFFSLCARLVFVIYGIYHDSKFVVKFTDVDYAVYTDASRFVLQGESPYLRDTYRYTPVLAWALTPNICLTLIWGKLLFCACDVIAGYLIYKILLLKSCNEKTALFCTQLWLYNPLTLTVSSRGNAESLLAVLVLLSIYCLTRKDAKSQIFAALIYGISVHMKIYPITYSLPIYLYLSKDYLHDDLERRSINVGKYRILMKLMWPNKARFNFVLLSVGILITLTCACYYIYGFEFLYETYLYHIVRRDTRHNFSPYFYMLYLNAESTYSLSIGLAAFLPQVLLLVVTSFVYYEDLGFCCFINTFIFVTFNKVCTSQYFLWYLSLLPLVVPKLNLQLKQTIILVFVWFLGQALWLTPAYYLEFEGKNTFVWIWLAGLLFFSTNIYIMATVIGAYSPNSSYNYEPITLGTTSFLARKKNE